MWGNVESMLSKLDEKLTLVAATQQETLTRITALEAKQKANEENANVGGSTPQAGKGGVHHRHASIDVADKLMKVHAVQDSHVKKHTVKKNASGDVCQANELKKISKLQTDEVFGLSAEMVNRTTAVRSKNNVSLFQTLRRGLLMPQSRFRLWWDSIACALISFIALVLPFRTAFITEWSLFWAVVDFIIDLFFIIDIFINFRTMYVKNGELIDDPKKIAKNYVKTWFGLDLISSVPVDWFQTGLTFKPQEEEKGSNGAQLTLLLRIFKLIKLLRLLRIARLLRYLGKWEDNIQFINSNVMRLLKLLFGLLFFSHWNGCIQVRSGCPGSTSPQHLRCLPADVQPAPPKYRLSRHTDLPCHHPATPPRSTLSRAWMSSIRRTRVTLR